MARLLPDVRPGDLITAGFVDRLVDLLDTFDTRISKLEGTGVIGGLVAIDSFNPSSTARVGERLEVNGRGFLVPSEINEVTIGGRPVPRENFRFGGSDRKVVFDIPPVTGLDPGGSPVIVSLKNANGTASAQMILRPALIVPQGSILVRYLTPPIMPSTEPNIRATKTYDFVFAITAFADRDGNYSLAPTITGGSGWGATITGSNPLNLTGNVSGTQRDVSVRVTAGTGTVTLRLDVSETSVGTRVTPGNFQIQIATGSPPPTPDNRVRILFVGTTPASTLDIANRIRFQRNAAMSIRFTLQFTEGGTYSVTAGMKNPAGWTSLGIDTPTLIVAAPTAGSTTNANINAAFRATDGAVDTDMVLTVTRGTDMTVQYLQGVMVL